MRRGSARRADLAAQALLDFGMLRKQAERPAHGRGDGFHAAHIRAEANAVTAATD